MNITPAKKKKLLNIKSRKEEPSVPEHFLLYFRVKSYPSMSLDYTEVTIERKNLASGAFGVVSRGKYRQQDVCIKTVSTLFSKEEYQALEQEMSVLEKVHSPFIVTYLGATRIPGQPVCLVMQYEKAGSLAEVMERKDLPSSERLRTKILLDAAKGVQHLHCNDVYHMDLKPGNMVIASLDENAQVNTKLIDFDLARISDDNNYKVESKGVHFGSIPYCPPEALNYEPHWRAETYDTYSFGITMWEVLSGKPLYPKMINRDIISYVTSGGRPEIAELNPKFVPLIERCWHQNRKMRPSFTQIVAELEELIKTLPKKQSPTNSDVKVEFNYVPRDDKKEIGWMGIPSRKQAEDMLLKRDLPVGTFLFRWSDKAKSYVMSYLKKELNGRESVDHIGFITPGVDGDIVVSGQNHRNTYYDSLTDYVADMKKKGIITTPLPLPDGDESMYMKTPHVRVANNS